MLSERVGQFYKAVHCKLKRQLKSEARMGLKAYMIWHKNRIRPDRFWCSLVFDVLTLNCLSVA